MRAKPHRPTLSIVVPVYNVETYLEECLESILSQPFQDFEVVLVDDGSTDRSGEIAQRYAAANSKIVLLSQVNAGLGAARNAGVRISRGQFLTFVDSDDALPPDAYSSMMQTLRRTGSDFVVGMLKRDDGGRLFATPRMRANHRVERCGITVQEMPQILADVWAMNKIFRCSFWLESGMAFPVGVRYEDQPALTHAFLSARAFDVIRDTVYLWRIRSDGSSITQRRNDIADLKDRITTKRDSHAMVMKLPAAVQRVWLTDVLPVDMGAYFREVPGCSDDYWCTLRGAVREFWSDDGVPFEETLVPVQQRLMGWLVGQDRRRDLEDLVAFVERQSDGPTTTLRGDKVICLLPGLDDPESGIPATLYELGAHELRWEARAVSADWVDRCLTLVGFALVRNVPTMDRSTSLSMRLVGEGGVSFELSPHQMDQPRATRFVNRSGQNYDDCGFTSTVDVLQLVGEHPIGAGRSRRWRFDLERRVDDLRRGGGITSWNPSTVTEGWHYVAESWWARLGEDGGELVLEVKRD